MKSSVVFVNPGVNADRNLGLAKRFAVKVPPLGIAYLAATLRDRGDHVHVYDQFAQELSDDELIRRVTSHRPDVVAFNVLTASASRTRRVCERLRQANPRLKVVLGNIHASIFHDRILQAGWADVVVHGEGEPVLPAVVDALGGRGDLASVPGVSFLDGGQVCATPRSPQIRDLDAIPLPAWERFNLEAYRTHTILSYGKRILPVITSRGCPWKCEFCSQNHFWPQVYMRDPDRVADEIRIDHERFGAEHITFHDANFPVTKRYGLEVCAALRRLGLHRKVTFVTEARMEIFDEELIAELARTGFVALMFGIESGSEGIRGTVHKTFTNRRIHEIVGYCRKYGLHTMGLFLVGLPGETRESIQETIDLACSLPLDLAKFNVVVPYPGSALFDRLPNRDTMDDADFDRIATFYSNGFDAVTVNENLTHAEIDRLQKKALLSFYLRPAASLRLAFRGPLSPGDIAVGGAALVTSLARDLTERLTARLGIR